MKALRRHVYGGLPALVVAALLGTSPLSGQSGALAEFGTRMVGSWEADDSRHVFEWGVGERILKSRSYWPAEDGEQLVSEGVWYWDPTAGVITGRTVAVGMGIDLFEYTTRIRGDTIVHEFEAHGDLAGSFVERWIFEEEGYSWVVEQDGAALLSGFYRRAR